MSWNPSHYLQYEDARLRPALELMARVPLDAPATIADLGCGAGNVTQALARRWPQARILGVDGDEAMLAKAREAMAADSRVAFERDDLARWRPNTAFDLLYSNAALHWIDDHANLFPRLARCIAPDGVLAVQMPDNFRAPSHVLLHETAASDDWRGDLARVIRPEPVAAPAAYYDWLAPHVATVDIWTTEYLQRLPQRDDGRHPVLAWMQGTTLIPFLEALAVHRHGAFLRDFASRLADAYPVRDDGGVLFPFRRMFIVARV